MKKNFVSDKSALRAHALCNAMPLRYCELKYHFSVKESVMKKVYLSIIFSIQPLLAMEPKKTPHVCRKTLGISNKEKKELKRLKEETQKQQKKRAQQLVKEEKRKKKEEEKARKRKEEQDKKQFKKAQALLKLLSSIKNKEKIEKVLNDKSDLNILTQDGKSPVNCVLDKNNVEVLQLLASLQCIDLAFQDKGGNMPLHALLKRDDYEIIPEWTTMFAILIEYLNGKGLEEKSPLAGLSKEQQERQKEIINAQDAQKWTPLHWAVERNNLDVIDVLYRNGANIDANLAEGGKTPLECASSKEMKQKLAELGASPKPSIFKSYDEQIQEIEKEIARLDPEKDTFQIQRLQVDIKELQAKQAEEVELLNSPRLKEQESRMQSVRKKPPGKNTLRYGDWTSLLQIPGSKPPGQKPVCSSYPPTTFAQPTFDNILNQKRERSRSEDHNSNKQPKSPRDQMIEDAKQAFLSHMRQSASKEHNQTKSCPELPPFIGFVVAKPRRTNRSISEHRAEKRDTVIGRSSSPEGKNTQLLQGACNGLSSANPERHPAPQRSVSVCFNGLIGESGRPQTPNCGTKPKTQNLQRSISISPRRGCHARKTDQN